MTTWTLEWHWAAMAGMLAIHWRTASRIGGALTRLAATSEGALERISGDPSRARLSVRGAVAILRLDLPTRTIHVLAIFGT